MDDISAASPSSAPHLLGWTRINPGALMFSVIWSIGYRTWVGLLVPLPLFLFRIIAVATEFAIGFFGDVPPLMNALFESPYVWFALWLAPSLLFAVRADGLAWRANPGRWTEQKYRKQQLWRAIAAAVLVALNLITELT